MWQLKNIMIKTDLSLEKNLYRYLKKQEIKKPILLKKEKRIEFLTKEDFEKYFDVKYLPNLYIENLATLRRIIKKCQKALKQEYIGKKEEWLGTYLKEKIQNGITQDVYIKWQDPYKEYGVFALKDIKKHSYIGEYTGILRKHKRKLDKKNGYCFAYQIKEKSSFTIDAKYMGNYLRFINHSYSPNLDLHMAYDGILHIILMTNKDIKKDEELTYNYGSSYWKKRENPK